MAKVVIVEDDPRVAAHVAHGVASHDGLSLAGTAGSLAEAPGINSVTAYILPNFCRALIRPRHQGRGRKPKPLKPWIW